MVIKSECGLYRATLLHQRRGRERSAGPPHGNSVAVMVPAEAWPPSSGRGRLPGAWPPSSGRGPQSQPGSEVGARPGPWDTGAVSPPCCHGEMASEGLA